MWAVIFVKERVMCDVCDDEGKSANEFLVGDDFDMICVSIVFLVENGSPTLNRAVGFCVIWS